VPLPTITRKERIAVERALNAAIYLRQAPRCGWAGPVLLALLKLRVATLTRLAEEVGIPLPTASYVVKALSTGRYDGRPSLPRSGREPHPIPPALPNLIYRGGERHHLELQLTPEGLEVARAMAGLP
jgi:hypothetical protein